MTGVKGRIAAFAVCVAVLAGTAVGYTGYALHRDRARVASGEHVHPAPGTVRLTAGGAARLVFRDTARGPGFGKLASVPLDDPTGARTVDTRACERSYAAAGRLLCLAGSSGLVVHHYAELYDVRQHLVERLGLDGLPSRARLSADGRMAAWTVFVYGDSYTSVGFSTRTGILDTGTGTYVPTLEEFTTYKGGKVFAPADRNFWGVSFLADDNTFYATIGSASHGGTYLVRGNFRARTMTVLRSNAECPSLSPDGTRLAFKKKVSADPSRPWRLYVLDLASMRETPLADTRSVDDQADWLDDHTVAYALPRGDSAFDLSGAVRGRLGRPQPAGPGCGLGERGALSGHPVGRGLVSGCIAAGLRADVFPVVVQRGVMRAAGPAAKAGGCSRCGGGRSCRNVRHRADPAVRQPVSAVHPSIQFIVPELKTQAPDGTV